MNVIATSSSGMKISITAYELMVLRRSAEGLSEQEIASELTLTKQEVANCKKNILRKLSASNPLQGIQNLAKTGFHIAD